jgi:hypothetical protein
VIRLDAFPSVQLHVAVEYDRHENPSRFGRVLTINEEIKFDASPGVRPAAELAKIEELIDHVRATRRTLIGGPASSCGQYRPVANPARAYTELEATWTPLNDARRDMRIRPVPGEVSPCVRAPGLAGPDQLGLVQTIDRVGRGIRAGASDRSYRRMDSHRGETLTEPDRGVLRSRSVWWTSSFMSLKPSGWRLRFGSQGHRVPPPPPSRSFAESVRARNLVATRHIPPGRGWRLALCKAAFVSAGLICAVGQPLERRQGLGQRIQLSEAEPA